MKKLIFLITLLMGTQAFGQWAAYDTYSQLNPNDAHFQACLNDHKTQLQQHLADVRSSSDRFYGAVPYLWEERELLGNKTTIDVKVWTYVVLSWGYDMSVLEWHSDRSYCSTFLTIEKTPAYKPDLDPDSPDQCGKGTLKKGSLIDTENRTLVESIPLSGTDFTLNYSSAYNSFGPSRNIRAEFNYADNPSSNLILKIAGTFGGVLHESTYPAPTPLFKVDYPWDGATGIISENDFLTKASFNVLIGKNNTIPEFCYNVLVADPNDPSGQLTIETTQCEPERKTLDPVSSSDVMVSIYKPAVWGLSGWTLSEHHYFDTYSKVLFSGSGLKVPYHSFAGANDPHYGWVTTVISKNGKDEIYLFDSSGRHLETRHAKFGYTIYKFNYTVDNKLQSVTDRFGKQTQFVFDGQGHLAQIIAPYGQPTTFTVVGDNLVTSTDPLGHTYEMQYDSNKLMTLFKSVTGEETVFAYSATGELLSETKNTGLFQSFTESSLETAKAIVHNTGAVAEALYMEILNSGLMTTQHDSEGRVVSSKIFNTETGQTTQVYGGTATTTNYTLAQIWLNDKKIPTSANTTITESGQNISIATNFSESITYSGNYNPLTLTEYSQLVSRAGQESSVLYDKNSNTLTATDPSGNITTTHLNGFGQVIKVQQPNQLEINYVYNADGQLTSWQQGNSSLIYAYDPQGHLASSTDSLGRTTLYNHDANGSLLEKTFPNGDKIKYEYTSGGEIKKITTPSNQEHNFQIGIGNYLQSYTDGANGVTTYIYDQYKRLEKVEKPSGREIAYNYKPQSENLASIEIPEGVITYNDIDAQARVRSSASADGIKMETSWVSSEIQSQTWVDEANSVIGKISYNFKPDELKIKDILINDQVVATYSYNADGRLASLNGASYDYYQDGLSFGTTIALNNTIITYSQQTQDNLPSLYVKLSTPQSEANQLNIEISHVRDDLGQVRDYFTSTINNNTGVITSSGELVPEYDANDRVSSVIRKRNDSVNGQQTQGVELVNQYSYPPGSNNNLKEFSQSSSIGGAVQKRTIATHSPDDRLLTLRGAITRDYTYNADGDLETMTNCYGETRYEYDVFSNLKKVTLPTGQVIEYKVDAENRRVKKLVNGTVAEYYLWYDKTRLAAVLGANKVPKLVYLYGPESRTPGFVIKGGNMYRILHNPGIGSIRYIVDTSTKQVLQEIEYDEYGNMMKNTNANFQPLTYAGGLYDADTKLIRFGARDYDPTIGRWTTKDPIGFAGGDTNLYGYVGQNPMSYYDTGGQSRTRSSPLNDPFIGGGGRVGIGIGTGAGISIGIGINEGSQSTCNDSKHDCRAIYIADHATCSSLRIKAPISVQNKCWESMAERKAMCDRKQFPLPPLNTGGY